MTDPVTASGLGDDPAGHQLSDTTRHGDTGDLPAPGATAGETVQRAWRGPSAGQWTLFGLLAVGIVGLDQVTKAWIVGNVAQGDGFQVLGDWIRIIHWRNSGILFGMLPQSAGAFAIVSLVVVALIVVYHAKAGRGLLLTVALGLLLGGALGNLVDRVHYGSVIDFVDMGIGAWRFYTYNVADAAISTAIVLLVLMALFPRLAEWVPGD
jgi:signal peptidase II